MGKMYKNAKRILRNIVMMSRSLLYNRDSSIVLLDSWFGYRFADNSRFIFQYLSENKETLGLTHVVWVSRNSEIVEMLRNEGYEVYDMESAESVYYHKKAKYHICNNAPVTDNSVKGEFLGQYSYGAKRINLWHGVAAVKGVGYNSNEYRSKHSKNPYLCSVMEWLHYNMSIYRKIIESEGGWGDPYYVAPTYAECQKMKDMFLLKDNKFIISGYARNCECPKLMQNEKEVIKIIEGYNHLVLYMPTFKAEQSDFDFRTVGKKLIPFLKERGILWIQKGHLVDRFANEYYHADNILSLTNDFDTNVIVPRIDVLVTDYSSAMMDCLYHNKPVLLFVPDYKEYVAGERGLIDEAKEIMDGCGYSFDNIESLENWIVKAIEDPDSVKPKGYYKTRKKYWGDDKTIAQIWEDIKSAVD